MGSSLACSSKLKNNAREIARFAMQTKPRKHCVCYVNARAGFFFFLRLDDASDVHALLKAARAFT